MSAYSNLNEPETKGYVSLPSIRPGPNFSMEVGEEPRGSPAEGHGLAVEEGRGRATRLLAHPAAFFSSRSGASAEGAAGRKTEESAPAAMAELAIFLRTSLHPCSPAARAARSARAAPDGAPWRGADGAGAMRRGEGSGWSSGAPFSGKIRPREGLLHPPRRRIGAQRRRIGSCLE